jgi:uncharacterized protein YlzI (FlbEa/FlbD family)
MNIKELAKEVQKMRSIQKWSLVNGNCCILARDAEQEIDALVEKTLAEPTITIEQINGVNYVSLEQLRKVTGVSAEELARAWGIGSQPKPPASVLSPSDFGPYLADELEQFDRYLAEFQGGVNFKEWVKDRIDKALWVMLND